MTSTIQWILDNWNILLSILIFCIYAAYQVCNQTKNIKEWLKYAVSKAEIELGSGTGKLKLSFVYNMLVTTYPFFGKIMSYNRFEKYVDDALLWMNKQLDYGTPIGKLLKGDNTSE